MELSMTKKMGACAVAGALALSLCGMAVPGTAQAYTMKERNYDFHHISQCNIDVNTNQVWKSVKNPASIYPGSQIMPEGWWKNYYSSDLSTQLNARSGDYDTQEEVVPYVDEDGTLDYANVSVRVYEGKSTTLYKNGKKVKPKVTVTMPGHYEPTAWATNSWGETYPSDEAYVAGGTLKKGKDYTVKYKNNKNIGYATVIIKGKGAWHGTYTKNFTIAPKAPKVKSVKGAKKAVTVNWKGVSAKQADGYLVSLYKVAQTDAQSNSYLPNGQKMTYTSYDFVKSVIVTGSNSKSVKIKGLSKKTKYYAVVEAYKNYTGSYDELQVDQYTNYFMPNAQGGFPTDYKDVVATHGDADVAWSNYSNAKSGKTK